MRGSPSRDHDRRKCAHRRRCAACAPPASPSMMPSGRNRPQIAISATVSMMPEPQMPVTPVERDRLGEAFFVRPEIAADHLEARLERRAVDAQALDGARRGALAAADLRALEGGPGRRRASEQPLTVAEHDLGIGADIDDEADLVGEIRGLRTTRRPPRPPPHGRRCRAARERRRRARRQGRSRAPGASKPASMVSAKGATPSSVGSRPSAR